MLDKEYIEGLEAIQEFSVYPCPDSRTWANECSKAKINPNYFDALRADFSYFLFKNNGLYKFQYPLMARM